MRKQHRNILLSFIVLTALLVSMAGPHLAYANGHIQQRSSAQISGDGLPAAARLVSMQTVDMHNVARVSSSPSPHRFFPRPVPSNSQPPPLTGSFQGLGESGVCPSGCEPPDLALAASPQWVFEGINRGVAIYDTTGVLQPGWPIPPDKFFQVPNPGSCAPAGPHLTDPRAFYDPNDGRFWAAMLEVEGANSINTCPEKTLYHIAVSMTSDPRGIWTTYAVDISLGTTNFPDFTQFGFDQQAVYISANMYNQAGKPYAYAEILGAKKSPMEQGQTITFYGFFHLAIQATRKVFVDTVQPVEVEGSPTGGPSGGLFINAFNGGAPQQFNGDPFGNDCILSSCHGLSVWTLTNPGTPSTGFSFAFVDTPNYIRPPLAQQRDSSSTLDTGDTRIGGTPPYHNGLLSFALNTESMDSNGNILSAIFWGQVTPVLNADGTLASASLTQQGVVKFFGDFVYYGTLMPDAAGNLFLVFDYSSVNTPPGWPSVEYVSHRTTDPPGSFDDITRFLRPGDAAYTFSCMTSHFCRWGDYTATSYDGTSTNNVWLAGQYASSDNEWSTYIGKTKF